jgi:hypothetical protein
MYSRDKKALPPGIKMVYDPRESESGERQGDDGRTPPNSQQPAPKTKGRISKFAATGTGGVQGLDIASLPVELQYRKAVAVLEAAGEDATCGICHGALEANEALVCSHALCSHTAHLTCLSSRFLDEEGGAEVLPIKGVCPGCNKENYWGNLVRELSLRTRARPKETKKKITAAVKRKTTKKGVDEEESESSDDDDDEAEVSCMDLADIPEGKEAEAAEASMMMLGGLSDDESVYEAMANATMAFKRFDPISEESDGWDSAELI